MQPTPGSALQHLQQPLLQCPHFFDAHAVFHRVAVPPRAKPSPWLRQHGPGVFAGKWKGVGGAWPRGPSSVPAGRSGTTMRHRPRCRASGKAVLQSFAVLCRSTFSPPKAKGRSAARVVIHWLDVEAETHRARRCLPTPHCRPVRPPGSTPPAVAVDHQWAGILPRQFNVRARAACRFGCDHHRAVPPWRRRNDKPALAVGHSLACQALVVAEQLHGDAGVRHRGAGLAFSLGPRAGRPDQQLPRQAQRCRSQQAGHAACRQRGCRQRRPARELGGQTALEGPGTGRRRARRPATPTHDKPSVHSAHVPGSGTIAAT